MTEVTGLAEELVTVRGGEARMASGSSNLTDGI